MYPYELFWGITLYDVFFFVGLMAAIGIFVLYSARLKLDSGLRVLVLADAAVSVSVGIGAAILMQSVYNYIESGVFEWGGMTFYGGLVGGAAVFLAVYFIGGRILYRKKSPYHLKHAFSVFGIAACCVMIAHAFGRLGCLTAGCCHGAVYAERRPFTVPLLTLSADNRLLSREYTVPIQLFEALFLFALFAVLSFRVLKGKNDVLPLYMIIYGIWRFGIEYARADDRGETFIPFLSPSQLTAILLILGGIALLVCIIVIGKRRNAAQKKGEDL